jgi:hypothetical protein
VEGCELGVEGVGEFGPGLVGVGGGVEEEDVDEGAVDVDDGAEVCGFGVVVLVGTVWAG